MYQAHFSTGTKVKDQCTLVRRRAWGRGYFSAQDSVIITTCSCTTTGIKSNAVYCTQNIYVIILYIYISHLCACISSLMTHTCTCCTCLLTLGAHAQRGLQYLVCKSVRLSVCYHVFCHHAQQGGQKAIPMVSVPHWLDFKNGDFRKSTAFKSYGMKTKRTSQYANEHSLPRPDSARFEHGGGSRSNSKGEYVVLVCQKHYLLT